MTEHERDELEEIRHQEIMERLERNREKSSQEHGAIVTIVNEQNRETRAHIGSEIETVAKDMAHFKNFMDRMRKAMLRFLARHGMGNDDL